MKLYIAAPWANRADMPEIASAFESIGCQITTKWWEVNEGESPSDEFLQQCAYSDIAGVIVADAVVVINSSKSEGKAVEQGVAIAHFKPIVIVGKRGEHTSNVFHYLPNYCWVETVQDAVTKFKGANE